MDWLYDLITNKFFITGITAWAVAQVLKVIIHTIVYKKFDYRRFFGDGGMPSCHSATVASLATISGLCCGFGSVEFAVCAILATIVCHDAMGVRLETGKQSMVLNEIIESFEILSKKELPEVKLKEFVGHTPIQVMAGILIGIAHAVVMYSFVW